MFPKCETSEGFLFVGKDERKKRKKDMSLEVENLQESVPDLRLLYRKNRKKRCLLKEYWGLFQGHLYLTSSDKVVFGKSMSVLSISLGYQLKGEKEGIVLF